MLKQGIIEPYYIENNGIFIPIINKVLAMKDSYEKPVIFSKAEKIPTLKEWYIILHFKDEINSLLVNNGGEKLKRDSYWSCDICDNMETHAFGVFIRDGITFDDWRVNNYYARSIFNLE